MVLDTDTLNKSGEAPLNQQGAATNTWLGKSPSRSGEEKPSIAELCVKEGVLTQSQLDYAMRVHAKFSTPRTLAQVLRDLNFVTTLQIRMVVKANCYSVRLAELL